MNALKTLAIATSLCLPALVAFPALAQSTDGYHSIQIFPLVVDNASFAQRFNFKNPNDITVTVTPKYYPALGLTGAVQLDCPSFDIPAGKTVVKESLRTICPALPTTGSQFGYMYTSETSGSNLPYAGFSRVANPQGNGFTVEAFPAHTFTSATSVVNGIRRLAATPTSPTYQSNCFVANINDVNALGSTSTTVDYTIYNSASTPIGGGQVVLLPGQITRMLDVFAIGGVVGDHNDAQIRFEEFSTTASSEPAIMSYCTVQESTTFGADFRIAKQELGAGNLALPDDVIGGQDNHVNRRTRVGIDGIGRVFELDAGDNRNVHLMYFRHPDYVQCELVNAGAAPYARLPSTNGLEMRMLDQEGNVLAGGNDATGFGEIYLGDKTQRNGGSNTRYRIEVEDAERNSAAVRPYQLHCQSGSGHTLGDLIVHKQAGDSF